AWNNSAAASPGSVQYDQNVLGDTSSELARRRAAALDSENGFTRDALRFLLSKRSRFLRFDTPDLATARMRPILDLASVPGLAGIALSDTAPPGYGPFHEKSDDWYTGLQDSGDFGYSPEMRLAFLRQEGYDPIDLSLTGTELFWGGSANLPFFPSKEVPLHTTFLVPQPDGSTRPNLKGLPAERWSAFRRERNEHLLGSLYQKIWKAVPNLPLMMAERSAGVRGPEFWGSWDAPNKLPFDGETTASDGTTARKDPHRISKTLYSTVTVPPDDSYSKISDAAASLPFALYAVVHPELNNTLRSDGLLIDLRALSQEKIREFLRLSLRPQDAAAK
ncbi:MAG: hypothetical protein V4671_27630, partial [Armatimonadota bacterium]